MRYYVANAQDFHFEMLEKGVKLNVQSFNNKISRTTFSATFFFQCMYVLETWLINFDRSNIVVTNKENDNGTRK